MATGPVTPKKKANQTTYTQVPASGPYDPFNQPTFQTTPTPTFTPATAPTSQSVGTGLGSGNAQTFGGYNGIPQSFADDIAADLNHSTTIGGNPGQGGQVAILDYGGVKYTVPLNPDGSISQPAFNTAVQQAWSATPADKRASYQSRDAQNIAGQNTAQVQGALAQQTLAGPAQNAQVANNLWQPVTQAQQRAVAAQNAQVTGDRQAETDLNNAVGGYAGTIRQNQTDRMNDINATNARDTGFAQDFMNETLAANQRNTGFANQLTDAANSTNANQTGLFNTFAGQMSGINANQSAALGQFQGDIGSANAQQNANLAQFGGAVSSANGASQQIVAQYQQQMSQLNSQDQQAYLQYLSETNPLMAQLVAQGSNPEYVHNMEDVVNRYRDLSTPQVTDQERFLAELARRKFESDDKSSRDAVMQQLATRGLKSGGLVIANQQAAQQQNSQDRMLNELGLNAQAVSRGMQGMQGYASASTALRNADDAMRNFQDQYAQNEYVRRGNLAQQRNQQGLNTTYQVGNRDTQVYDARRQTNQDIYGRNLDYYNNASQTVNDNFSRTQAGYDAVSQTNRDNAGRDLDVMNQGTITNNDNYGRTSGALANQEWVNQGNLGNTSVASNRLQSTNDANSVRTQGGLDKGDLGAGSILGAQTGAIGFRTGNRQAEANTQNGYVPTAASAAQTGVNIQQGLTNDQQLALARLLGLGNADQAKAAAGLN